MTFAQGFVLLVAVGLIAYLVVLFVRVGASSKDTLETRKRVLKDFPDTILTAPGIVVSYRPNPKKLEVFAASGSAEGISKTLLEIITANPDADLAKFADALGILVTNVERRKSPEKPAEPDVAGVVLGRRH